MITKAHKSCIKELIGLNGQLREATIYDFFRGEGKIYAHLTNIQGIISYVKDNDKPFRKASELDIRKYIVDEMYNISIPHSYSPSLRQVRRNFLRTVYPLKQTMDDAFFEEIRSDLNILEALPDYRRN